MPPKRGRAKLRQRSRPHAGAGRRGQARLIRRSDQLTNACATIEDLPKGQIGEERRRRTLGILVEEQERTDEEARRYKEDLGLSSPEEPTYDHRAGS